MPTNFPTSLDSFTNPTQIGPGQFVWDDGTIRDAPTPPANILVAADPALTQTRQHTDKNDAITAIETKLGIDNSSVSTSIDYLLKNSLSIDPGHRHNLAGSSITGRLTFTNIVQVPTDRLLGRDTAGTGDIEVLTATGGIEFTGTGIITSAFTGDVTKAAGGTAQTIANDAVTNAKMANMATQTIKGRTTAGTGDPEDLTVTEVNTMLIGYDIATYSMARGA